MCLTLRLNMAADCFTSLLSSRTTALTPATVSTKFVKPIVLLCSLVSNETTNDSPPRKIEVGNSQCLCSCCCYLWERQTSRVQSFFFLYIFFSGLFFFFLGLGNGSMVWWSVWSIEEGLCWIVNSEKPSLTGPQTIYTMLGLCWKVGLGQKERKKENWFEWISYKI